MHAIWKWLAAIVVFLAVLGGSRADAGNPLAKPTDRTAREHLERGNRLYNTRAFDEAITEYKAGALAEPAPVFDYNLGQAYRQLGRYQDALWHYARFLKYGNPTGELLDAVNGFMTEMRAQLANRAPNMPPTGPAATEAAASPGTAGAPSTAAAAASPSTAGAARTVGARSVAERNDRAEQLDRVERTNEADAAPWFGWTMLGTGAAATGASVVLLLRASALHEQANAEPDVRKRVELHDQGRTRNMIGAAVGIGGLALTVTGVVMLVRHPHRPRSASTASLDIGLSGHSVAVFGRF
jgi:tetratricopeptide (TPR) repeat protein